LEKILNQRKLNDQPTISDPYALEKNKNGKEAKKAKKEKRNNILHL